MGRVSSCFEQFGVTAHGQGLLGVEEDLGNSYSLQGIYGCLWNLDDQTSRIGHVSSYFEQFGDAAGHKLKIYNDNGTGQSFRCLSLLFLLLRIEHMVYTIKAGSRTTFLTLLQFSYATPINPTHAMYGGIHAALRYYNVLTLLQSSGWFSIRMENKSLEERERERRARGEVGRRRRRQQPRMAQNSVVVILCFFLNDKSMAK